MGECSGLKERRGSKFGAGEIACSAITQGIKVEETKETVYYGNQPKNDNVR